jgi:trk system potassium uptake protein TrkA
MKQVCVIGLGQFGTYLARDLVRLGCEVLAIDAREDRVQNIRDEVHRAVIGDVRKPEMLAGVLTAPVSEATMSLGDRSTEPSILCALHLKHLGVERIRSTAANDDHAEILRAVGVTEIIYPERETAERVARRIANPNFVDMFPLAEDYRIMEVLAPQVLHGRSLAESGVRSNYNLLVLALRAEGDEHYRFLPTADTVIRAREVMMVMGRELDLARFLAA